MSLSRVRKLLKRKGSKSRKKLRPNLLAKKQTFSAGMGQKTPASYGKPVKAVDVF
jgi:hypothetical protein